MFVILGLGNPGQSYGKTRHNAGFMAVDCLALESGVRLDRRGDGYVYGVCRVGEEEAVLAKPLTYMNLSGGAAERLLRLYGVSPSSLIVVYDDCDLELGRLSFFDVTLEEYHETNRSLLAELDQPGKQLLALSCELLECGDGWSGL